MEKELPPLRFEFYGDDIKNARTEDVPDLTQNVEQAILVEELKLSCTNVMLQCLDTESRCIFILLNMPCGMPSLRRPCLPAQTMHESVDL